MFTPEQKHILLTVIVTSLIVGSLFTSAMLLYTPKLQTVDISKSSSLNILQSGTVQVGTNPCSYQIFIISATTYAQSCNGGGILDQSTDAAGVIDDAIGNLTSGGKIFIHAGTYTLTTTRINLGAGNVASIGTLSVNNIELYGEGEGATILVAGTNLNAVMLSVTNANGWYIHDLALNGARASQIATGSGNPYLEGISLYNSNNDIVSNVYVHDQKTYGIYVYGVNDKVTNSWVQNNNANGLMSVGGSDIVFSGNLIDGASDVGIDLGGNSGGANVSRIIAQGNLIKNVNLGISPWGLNSGTAIGLGDNGNVNQATVIGNSIAYCSGYGISWVGKQLENVVVSDNNIYKCKAGIYFKNTLDLQITGNIIDDLNGPAISAPGITVFPYNNVNVATLRISDNILSGTENSVAIQVNGVSGSSPIVGAVINGNYISSGPGTSNQFTGIYVKYCDFTIINGNYVVGPSTEYGSGIDLSDANATNVSGNTLYDLDYGLQISPVSSDYSIETQITSNIFKSLANGIYVEGNGNDIFGNSFLNITSGADRIYQYDAQSTRIVNNLGYNPVGHITNPWVSSGALISDSGGSAFPTNSTLYTVNNSPKVIMVVIKASYGTSKLTIEIDGTTVVSLTPTVGDSYTFTLAYGETFYITYDNTSNTGIYVSGQ